MTWWIVYQRNKGRMMRVSALSWFAARHRAAVMLQADPDDLEVVPRRITPPEPQCP